MRISIITVCYNSSKTIENTIKSVQNQNYPDIEYIIIDGASIDGTVDIIRKYENIIDKWVSEADRGLYDAINKGISRATGLYVGILNSDDVFFENNTVEKIADFLKANAELDAVTGDIVQHRNGKIIRKYSSAKWLPHKLKIGFMPPHPSIFMRTALFEKFGNYSTDYKIGADYELIIRYFLKNKIKYKYSGITTTSMTVGGVSSSGINSYNIITREIKKAFVQNGINYSSLMVRLRGFWKVFGYLSKK